MAQLHTRVEYGILKKECPYKKGVMIASLDCQRCEHYVKERSDRGFVMAGRIPDIFSTHSYNVTVFCKADAVVCVACMEEFDREDIVLGKDPDGVCPLCGAPGPFVEAVK